VAEETSNPETSQASTAVGKAFVNIIHRALKDVEAPLQREDILKAVEDLTDEELTALVGRFNDTIRRFFRGYQAEAQSPVPSAMVMAQYGIAAGIACEAVEHIQPMIPGAMTDAQIQGATKLLLGEVKRTILTKLTGQLILPPGVGHEN
jgi:hypothetical protein